MTQCHAFAQATCLLCQKAEAVRGRAALLACCCTSTTQANTKLPVANKKQQLVALSSNRRQNHDWACLKCMECSMNEYLWNTVTEQMQQRRAVYLHSSQDDCSYICSSDSIFVLDLLVFT